MSSTPSLQLGLSTVPKVGYRSSLSMFLRNSYFPEPLRSISVFAYSSHGSSRLQCENLEPCYHHRDSVALGPSLLHIIAIRVDWIHFHIESRPIVSCPNCPNSSDKPVCNLTLSTFNMVQTLMPESPLGHVERGLPFPVSATRYKLFRTLPRCFRWYEGRAWWSLLTSTPGICPTPEVSRSDKGYSDSPPLSDLAPVCTLRVICRYPSPLDPCSCSIDNFVSLYQSGWVISYSFGMSSQAQRGIVENLMPLFFFFF